MGKKKCIYFSFCPYSHTNSFTCNNDDEAVKYCGVRKG